MADAQLVTLAQFPSDDWRQTLGDCRSYWAHPLLVPTILMDIFTNSLKNDISHNIAGVERLENKI